MLQQCLDEMGHTLDAEDIKPVLHTWLVTVAEPISKQLNKSSQKIEHSKCYKSVATILNWLSLISFC